MRSSIIFQSALPPLLLLYLFALFLFAVACCCSFGYRVAWGPVRPPRVCVQITELSFNYNLHLICIQQAQSGPTRVIESEKLARAFEGRDRRITKAKTKRHVLYLGNTLWNNSSILISYSKTTQNIVNFKHKYLLILSSWGRGLQGLLGRFQRIHVWFIAFFSILFSCFLNLFLLFIRDKSVY